MLLASDGLCERGFSRGKSFLQEILTVLRTSNLLSIKMKVGICNNNNNNNNNSNSNNWKGKQEKNKGFNGIRTRDLRDTGAMLYQLSYEATHWKLMPIY